MKKNVSMLLVCLGLILWPSVTNAHPGGLDSSGCHTCKTNCPKWGLSTGEYHCHSGNTYTNSKGQTYNKSGELVQSENKVTTNSETKQETTTNKETTTTNNNTTNSTIKNTDSNKTTTNSNSSSTTKNSTTKNTTTKTKTTEKEETQNATEEKEKASSDTSLEYIKIDGEEVEIHDIIEYETIEKNIKLAIKANDDKSSIDYENKELVIGKNTIVITVKAEDKSTKEYKLNITRKESVGLDTITKFKINSTELTFENNKAIHSISNNAHDITYSYELSNKDSKVNLYLNNELVENITKVNNNDIIKVEVIDRNDNINTYEVTIREMSKIETIFVTGFAIGFIALFLGGPIALIVFVVKKIKKRK